MDAGTPGPPLAAGRAVRQSFPAVVDGLGAIELLLASYGRTADGTLIVTLWREDGRVAGRWTRPAAAVADNAWHRFDLASPLAGVAGERLTVGIDRPEVGGGPVTVWTAAGDAYPAGEMRVVEGEASGGADPAGERAGGVPGGDMAFRAIYRPGWWEGARHLLSSTGYRPLAALALTGGLLASAMGFLYTYHRDARGIA